MKRQAKYFPFVAVAAVLLAAGALLRAETLDMDLFTAQAPAGWTASPTEGAYVIFDPDEAISLIINYSQYERPDFAVMGRRLAAEKAVRELADSAGFLFAEDKAYRFWRGLTPAGQSLEISVNGTHPRLSELLRSLGLSSAAQNDQELAGQLQSLLENLKQQEVLDWLTGAVPLSADPPRSAPEPAQSGEPETRIWQGLNLTAKAPQSWSIAAENEQTRFTSPDQSEYLLLIPLPALKLSDFGDDFARYKASCVEEIAKIGGVNLRAAEGTIYFDRPDLSKGEIFYAGDDSFILIRQGNSPELEALHWSLLE